MRSFRDDGRIATQLSLLLGLLLTLGIGCANLRTPKTIAQGDVSPKIQKRQEEVAREFEKQRDAAEYEAAKTRWEHQGDVKGCRGALEKLLARNPQHRDSRLLLVDLLLSEEDPQTACDQAKAALDACPNDAEVQYTVALTLDALGRSGDALAYYERATRMEPGSERFATAYRTATEASRDEERRSPATTIDIAESRNELAAEGQSVGFTAPLPPKPTPAKRADANGIADSADSPETAESDAAAEWLLGGQAALAEENPPRALECFRQAAAINPNNPHIAISAAATALRAGHPEVAVELLTAAAKQFPKSAGVHRMLGAAQYRLGDYKSSQVALQQALSLDKSSALSYLLMGCTLAKLGQAEAAEAHFRQARSLDPRYKLVR